MVKAFIIKLDDQDIMLTIFHGDDLTASRQAFFEEKQKYPHAIQFDGNKVLFPDLVQALQSDSLFFEEKQIFIENLTKRKQKDLKDIIELLNKHSEHFIVLWEGQEIAGKLLAQFPKAKKQLYKLPVVIFTFLENIIPDNMTKSISLFYQSLDTKEPELIFYLMIRHIRILLALEEASEEKISELKRLQSWQIGRLKKQKNAFSEEQLIQLYKKLYTIEYGLKTGIITIPLIQSIDFLLASI